MELTDTLTTPGGGTEERANKNDELIRGSYSLSVTSTVMALLEKT